MKNFNAWYLLALFAISLPSYSAVISQDKKEEVSIETQAKERVAYQDQIRSLKTIITFVPFIVGVAGATYLSNSENWRWKLLGTVLSGVFSHQMIAQALSRPTMNAFSSLAESAVSFLPGASSESIEAPLHRVQVQYEKLSLELEIVKPKLTQDTVRLFERLQKAMQSAKVDATTMSSFGADASANEGLKKQLEKIVGMMETLLSLPYETKEVPAVDDLKEKLAPILSRFNKAMQDDIKRLTIAIARAAKVKEGAKFVTFLVGEPGVGKTTFVRMYAKAIGLPLIEITDIEQALSTKSQLFMYGNHLSDDFKMSIFSDKLMGGDGSGRRRLPKNAILFLDEIDKFFSNQMKARQMHQQGNSAVEMFLLQLFDPNRQTVRLLDLDIEIDTSNLIIIAAGNEKLPEALRNRMTEFEMPCIEPEKRPGIAKARYDLLMNERPDLPSTSEDQKMLLNIVAKDPYCGVRSLEFVVDDYVKHKDAGKADWNLDPTFDIDAHFRMHPAHRANGHS